MSQIIVGVPGPWEQPADLIKALLDAHGPRYLFAGRIFMDAGTKLACGLEWQGHDERMRDSFAAAGMGRIPSAELEGVEAHRSVVYLLFGEPGLETARTAVRSVRALLQAGGLGAKVETAGIAQPRARWLKEGEEDDLFHLYTLLVQLVGGDDIVYSCGMHNFGHPDAAVPAAMDPRDAAFLLNAFNLFQIAESPVLNEGETFGTEEGAPRYRLSRMPYPAGYDPEDPLHNPHGLWMLRPDEEPRRRRWSLFRGRG